MDAVGDTPTLAFQRSDGTNGSLADFRGKNTVVQFWASWCAPCKKQLPTLKTLHEKLASRGYATVGLSLDEDATAWRAAVEHLDAPWPQGRLTASDKAGVSSVPAYWLLDPVGKIIAKATDIEELAAAVKEK